MVLWKGYTRVIMSPTSQNRQRMQSKASRAVKQGGKKAAQSMVKDSQRNLGRDGGGDKGASKRGQGVSFEGEKRFFKKAGLFLVRHWKATLAVLGVVFILFMGAAVIQQTVGVVKTVERYVAGFLPDSWQADVSDDGFDLSAEEQAEIESQIGNDPEMLSVKGMLDYCLGEGYGKIDSVVAYAAEAVDKDTKAEYARAWITYVSSDPVARAALIYHHPEIAAPDEGRVYTAEEIAATGQYVYTRDELYYLYGVYESNFPASQRSAADFVSRISQYAYPERFEYQINAVTWALYNRKITPDGSSSTIDSVLKSCQSLIGK